MKIETTNAMRLFNLALAEFDERSKFAFDKVTDIAALASYCRCKGWNWLATEFEIYHANHANVDKI